MQQPKQSKEIVQYEPEDPLLQNDFNEDLDFDVGAILGEIEETNIAVSQVDKINKTCTTVQQQVIKKSPNIPVFQNCKIGSIGNIHLHIHKH